MICKCYIFTYTRCSNLYAWIETSIYLIYVDVTDRTLKPNIIYLKLNSYNFSIYQYFLWRTPLIRSNENFRFHSSIKLKNIKFLKICLKDLNSIKREELMSNIISIFTRSMQKDMYQREIEGLLLLKI